MKNGKLFLFSESIQLKAQDGEFYVEGTASTINPDLGNDIVSEEALHEMASTINARSENNPIPIGYDHTEYLGGRPTLVPLGHLMKAWVDNGKLKVKGWLNKTLTVFKDAKSSLDRKELNSFSIEYQTKKTSEKLIEGVKHRIIHSLNLVGMALTGRPMNQEALLNFYAKNYDFANITEVKQMVEEKEKKEEAPENKAEEEKKEEPEKVEEKAEEEKKEETPEVKSIDPDLTEFKEWKVEKDKAKKVTEFKTLVDERVKEAMKTIESKSSPLLTPGGKFEAKETEPEVKNFKEVISDDKSTIQAKYAAAAKLHNKLDPSGITFKGVAGGTPWKQKTFEITGTAMQNFAVKHLEYKAQLEHDTHKVEDTDYYQNAAELNDIYDPVIRSHLNDKTTMYGLLRKENASEYPDRYGFRAWIARVAGIGGTSTAYEYDEGDTLTGYNAQMLKCQIPFMWYGVTLQVSGQMMAAATGRGGVGDIFSKEVERGSADLLRGINADIFYSSGGGSTGFTAGGKILSLPYLLATASDLYGLDRNSTYTTLQGTTTAKTGTPNPSKDDLRVAIRTVRKNGASRGDLLIVCDHIQEDKILGLLDPAQRLTTSPKAGFEGMPSFDGVPIHADDQCDDGYLYVIDMRHTFLAVQVAPTYSDLAKTDDSKKGFVKTYFALVCTAPNHNYVYTGYATS